MCFKENKWYCPRIENEIQLVCLFDLTARFRSFVANFLRNIWWFSCSQTAPEAEKKLNEHLFWPRTTG